MVYQNCCSYFLLLVELLAITCGEGTAYSSGAPEFTPVFSGVRVTLSIVSCVYFVDRCLSICPFPFVHCVVCPSSIYGFRLPLCYLQTLLTIFHLNDLHILYLFTSNELLLDPSVMVKH